MRYIPKKIKSLFSRQSRKEAKEAKAVAAAAQAAAATAAATAAEEARAAESRRIAAEKLAARQEKRRDGLARFRTDDGIYAIDLDIGQPGGSFNGQMTLMVAHAGANYYRAFVGASPLAGGKRVAEDLKAFLKEEYGLEIGRSWFRLKNEKFYLDTQDEYIGLPPGQSYQILLVPEGVKWKPPVYVPAKRTAPEGSNPLLQPPLLPPYLRANPDNPMSGPRFR